MKNVINGAQGSNIITLCEASHGQLKITEARIELFKILCKKYGFYNFVLEDQWGTCQKVDRYIKGKGSLKEAFDALMMPWRTTQFRQLLIWMKRFNKINGNLISFYGIDVQYYDYQESPPKSRIDKIAYGFIEELKKSAHQRDYLMAEMFKKIYKRGEKYVLYGHIAHFCNFYLGNNINNPSCVKLLEEDGFQIYKIGNTLNKGGYYAFNPKKSRYEIIKVDLKSSFATGVYLLKRGDTYTIYSGGFWGDSKRAMKYIERDEITKENMDAVISFTYEEPLHFILFPAK